MVKNAKVLCIAIIIAFSSACYAIIANDPLEGHSMKMFRIKEPLQIIGEEDGYYVLPVGAVLYYEDSFAEGHSLFWTPFYHKGKIKWEEVPLEPEHKGRLIDPLWLENIDALQLKDILMHFPLTKSDVKAAIEANQITKDDLMDIIRSMPE